jgi:hypothetical protein
VTVLRHVFRPIPGFPGYEISDTGFVLSLPRYDIGESRGTRAPRYNPGGLMAYWRSPSGTCSVTMRDADGRKIGRGVALLLRRVWGYSIDKAHDVAQAAGKASPAERPQPLPIVQTIPPIRIRPRLQAEARA